MEIDEEKTRFVFIDKRFDSISGKENKEYLMKWGMHGKLKTFMFTFDKAFHLGKKDSFLREFFNSEAATKHVQSLANDGTWKSLALSPSFRLEMTEVRCTELTVELFDRLYDNDKYKIVRENGSIRKCLDEYQDDILISDELRKVLVLEESDHYDIYSPAERNEFLFRLFKHVCLGGLVCQFEDTLQPYVDVARSIYKELVSVQKDADSKKLKIVSQVYRVELFEGKRKVYPNDTVCDQDFCYVIVDPFKRHLIVLYHRFDGPLFMD